MITNSLLILEKKLNFLPHFFAKQCSLPKNNSELPKNLLFFPEKHLIIFQISNDIIIKVVSSLDSNKAHGRDMISIRMLKLCSPSLCEPL